MARVIKHCPAEGPRSAQATGAAGATGGTAATGASRTGSGALPVTGSDRMPELAMGLILAALGTIILVARRRLEAMRAASS